MALKEKSTQIGEMVQSHALCGSSCIWTIMVISNLFFNIKKVETAQVSKPKIWKDNKNCAYLCLVFTSSKCLLVPWIFDG